eukprot:TRINITY_DN49049_c0_g1_i1.p1 TRINITY_DN49049_c0_g1~~TRINITY_DN49049_c0_g1_i1.p1  ORF type:complete len:201 (-),score=42.62 TRINITY_DN49049_c0_g1_i1:96-698(-)
MVASRKRSGSSSGLPAGGKQRPRLQSIEAQVAQTLRGNYGKLTPEETDVVRDPLTQMTLRQRLRKDIEKTQGGDTVCWGRMYHDALKRIYRREADAGMLEPGDKSEQVTPLLMKAMIAVKRAKPDRRFMMEFIASVETVNSTEVSGLFRWMLTLRVGCTRVQLPAAMKCLEFITRLKLHTAYIAKFDCIKPWVETVLLAV